MLAADTWEDTDGRTLMGRTLIGRHMGVTPPPSNHPHHPICAEDGRARGTPSGLRVVTDTGGIVFRTLVGHSVWLRVPAVRGGPR